MLTTHKPTRYYILFLEINKQINVTMLFIPKRCLKFTSCQILASIIHL